MIKKLAFEGLQGFTAAFTGYVLWNWTRAPERIDVEEAIYVALAVTVGAVLGSIWRSKAVVFSEIEFG